MKKSVVNWGSKKTLTRTFSGTLLNLTGLCTKAFQNFSEPSPEPCWTWPGKASQTFSGTFSGTLFNLTWLCTKASRNLLRNLLRNPVAPDLALHQGFLEPSPEHSPEPCWTWQPHRACPEPSPEPSSEPCCAHQTWLCTKASQTFSGTFFGTLLNLTWFCTKASQTFSRSFSGTLLNLTWLCTTRTFSGTLLNLTRLCTKAFQNFSGTFSGTLWNLTRQSLPDLLRNLFGNPVQPDLALHQSLPEPSPEPSSEPSPEPCWTCPGFAPKTPGPSPEPTFCGAKRHIGPAFQGQASEAPNTTAVKDGGALVNLCSAKKLIPKHSRSCFQGQAAGSKRDLKTWPGFPGRSGFEGARQSSIGVGGAQRHLLRMIPKHGRPCPQSYAHRCWLLKPLRHAAGPE